MSIQFIQGKLQDQERKTILQQVQRHMQQAAQEAVRTVVTDVLEAVKRGAKADNGLKAIIRDGCGGLGRAVELVYAQSVVDQRCIFHKLKNMRDKCRTDLKGDDHQEQRRQLMQEARAVYQAESAEQAKERFAVWSAKTAK